MSIATTAGRAAGWSGWWRVGLVVATVLAAVGVAVLWRLERRSTADFTEYRMLSPTDIPTAVAVGPTGAVWFTIEFSDAIGVVRNGRIERLPKGEENVEPLGLAVDGEGYAWFTDSPARAVARMSPAGALTTFPLSTPIARLGRLAIAPDGAVWFADALTPSVTRLARGVFTFHPPSSFGAGPFGVAVSGDGTVWATLPNANKLLRISPAGQLTEFDVPTRGSGLGDLAVDASGAVWFVELRTNKIGRFAGGHFTEFAVPTPSAGLTALAVAPDGSVWFTELRAHALGRLRDGRITEFPLPRATARPFGIAADAANNVWYTDLGGWLGRLSADGARAR